VVQLEIPVVTQLRMPLVVMLKEVSDCRIIIRLNPITEKNIILMTSESKIDRERDPRIEPVEEENNDEKSDVENNGGVKNKKLRSSIRGSTLNIANVFFNWRRKNNFVDR
jgi:hypothetical protein